MLCPFCKEEIIEGAVKCKHCQSMLNETAEIAVNCQEANHSYIAPPEGHLVSPCKVEAVAQEFLVDPDGHAKIDALNASRGLKNKLHLVQDYIKDRSFNIPLYSLEGLSKLKTWNWWAFVFGIFYYLVKGMWRKAIVFFAIIVNIEAILSIVTISDKFYFLIQIMCFAILAISAYYDIYRKEVLKETFWW